MGYFNVQNLTETNIYAIVCCYDKSRSTQVPFQSRENILPVNSTLCICHSNTKSAVRSKTPI